MSKDLPYIIKETCFGNMAKTGKNDAAIYNIWYAGDCVIVDYDGLVHLHTVISEIISLEKLDASSQSIVEALKKQDPTLKGTSDEEIEAKLNALRGMIDMAESSTDDAKSKGGEQ